MKKKKIKSRKKNLIRGEKNKSRKRGGSNGTLSNNTIIFNDNETDLTQEEIDIINTYLASTSDSPISIDELLERKCGKVLNYLNLNSENITKNKALRNLIYKILKISHINLRYGLMDLIEKIGFDEIITDILNSRPESIKFMSYNFKKNNIIILMSILGFNGMLLKYIPNDILEENKKLIEIAIHNNPLAIRYVADKNILKNYLDIVKSALIIDGTILLDIEEIMSDELIRIVLESCQSNSVNMFYVRIPNRFLTNFENAAIAIKKTHNVNELYNNLHDDLRHNPKIILLAMKFTYGPRILYNILPFFYKQNIEVALAAIKRQRRMLVHPNGMINLYNNFFPSIQHAPIILAELGYPHAPQGRQIF